MNDTSTDWLEAQNSSLAITAIGAADHFWSVVQRLRAAQLGLVVILPTLFAIAAQFKADLTVTAGLLGFALTIIDTVLIYPFISMERHRAAQAQDIFDSIALDLPRSELRRSQDPDQSDLRDAAAKQNRSRAARNRDWYSRVLGQLPCAVGRIACMKESTAWDGGLRVRYVWVVVGCSVSVFLGFITYALFSRLDGASIVTRILFPLTPAIVWAGRELWDHFDASRGVCRLREALQNAWNDGLAGRVAETDLSALAVDFSAALFAYRSETAPVPHLLYGLLRNRQAVSMQEAAQDLVNEHLSLRLH